MSICALAYVGVRSAKLADWSAYACGFLGMQQVDGAGKSLAFRMDDRAQRFVVTDERGDSLAFMGFEVEDESDLESYAARLDAADVEVQRASRDLCDRRLVTDLITFNDPAGNRLELVHAPMDASEPFVPGRSIDAFKTGPLGMGHVVLHVAEVEMLSTFYRDVLDFRVTDYGLTPYGLYFFHINGRHHSFAMVGSGQSGFHHFMVEYQNLDDVGQGYDMALANKQVAYTLGRHTNDWVTSFYSHSPSDFFVETGWGGQVLDVDTWEARETFDGPSFWGHDRIWLTQEEGGVRERMRTMAVEAAQKGLRAPRVAHCPWLYDELAKR